MFVDAYEAAKSKDVDKTRAYDELVRESGKILGMTKNATAAAKYAISLRGHIDKRVLWPQDMIQPDEEEKIKEQMKKVDSMYEALKK